MDLSPIIRTLPVILPPRGRIKIGEKGSMTTSRSGREFQPPRKLDYLRVTTLERGPDGNFMPDVAVQRLYGERPRELPIRLIYDDISLNMRSQFMCMSGRALWCYGDGERALRLTSQGAPREIVSCPCGREQPTYTGPDRCRIHTVLRVWIDGIDAVGGVYEFRTSSYHSTVGLLGSLSLIQRITHGVLAGIPLMLVLRPRTVIAPDTGATQTVWVVGVEYRGSVEALQAATLEIASQRAAHAARIEHIEAEARKLISTSAPLVDAGEVDDVVDEFYPEAAQSATEPGPQPIAESLPEPAPGPIPSMPQPAPEAVHEPTPKPAPAPHPTHEPTPEPAPKPDPGKTKRKRFTVDPELFSGRRSITTSGVTPEQMLILKELAKENKGISDEIRQLTGEARLSSLTEEQALALITKYQAIDVSDVVSEEVRQESDAEMVECPNTGDMVSKGDCYRKCKIRAEFNYCPAVDGMPTVDL